MTGWFESGGLRWVGDIFAFIGSVIAFVFLMVVAVGMLFIFSWPWFIATMCIAFVVLRLGLNQKL